MEDTSSVKRRNVYKIVILGEAGVGKSSLVRRYTQGYFSSRTTTTVGVDRVPVNIAVDDENLSFQVLDTAGCFGFRGLIKSYMNNVDAVIFVYDLTNKETFASLPLWNTVLKNTRDKNITKILVGNKRDLDESRQVKFKNAKNYAEFEGMVAMEISVKEAESVDLVFQCVARELKSKQLIRNMEKNSSVLSPRKQQQTFSNEPNFVMEDNETGPKQFIRGLSMMLGGKRKKREPFHTPSLARKADIPRTEPIRKEHFRWV